MAVAMVQDRRSQVPELDGFLVPKILRVNLKKKAEDRPATPEENGGRVNRICGDSSEIIENVQKNSPDSLEDRLNSIGNEEELIEMAPERHQLKGKEKQSSYLLQPFFKPVAQHIEVADNPILRALFGANNQAQHKSSASWVAGDKTTTSCHPFKKSPVSQSQARESNPEMQIPKSLSRDEKKNRNASRGEEQRKSTSRPLKENTSHGERKASPTAVTKTQSASRQRNGSEKENRPVVQEMAPKKSPSVHSRGGNHYHLRSRISSVNSLKKTDYVNTDKLMKLRLLVDNAIKNHKVYSMTGCYNSVRNALKQRGWIEKIDSDVKGKRRQNKYEEIDIYDAAFQFVQKFPTLAAMRYSIQNQSGFSHNHEINYTGQGEAEIINRMLRNVNEDLCWLSRPYPFYCLKDMGKFDLINRLPKAHFSNKIGLCNSLQHIQWYFEPGVCSTQYPRTYNMSLKEEFDAFIEDFRLTACIGLLKWLTATYRSEGEKAVRSIEGKIDTWAVEFALKRCSEYVKYREHEDIDLPDVATVWDYQWDHFIAQYYRIINEGQILKECKNDPSIQVYVTNALSMLNLIKNHWPQINIDGYQNFWVVKPGGRCCGNGILIKNNLEQILMLVNPTVTKETRYVVQKYIEKPLLIYKTKFDIRQWFLVTNVYPLTVWMYRESYLRFCSQPFSLKNTHESIHLCNNAVQRRYKNSKRDRGLPDENMWDCYTFQTYLKSIGHPDVWEKHIYPGMKEGFVGALLASQDTMERRRNCFELYGADFMISESLTDGPWLIEINSNPAMDSSTSVTARMCPQVLEDVIKVIIDRRDDKNAPTGAFELVFKQHCPPMPPYLGMSLSIKGQKVNRSSAGDTKMAGKKSKSSNSSEKLLQSETEDSQSEDPNEGKSDYRRDREDADDIRPVLSSEILEGLKKEILRAKFSVGIADRGRGAQLKRPSFIKKYRDILEIAEESDVEEHKIRRSQSETVTRLRENPDEKKPQPLKTYAYMEKILPQPEETIPEYLNHLKHELSNRTEEIIEPPTIEESHRETEIPPEELKPEPIKQMETAVETSITILESHKTSRAVVINQMNHLERSRIVEKPKPAQPGPSIKPPSPPQKKITTRYAYNMRHRQIWRKKIDFIRKNIEDVRKMPKRSTKRLTERKLVVKFVPRTRNVELADFSDYENVYRDELLKMMNSMTSRKFINQLCDKSEKYNPILARNRMDRKTSHQLVMDTYTREMCGWQTKDPIDNEIETKSETGIPRICEEIASQLNFQLPVAKTRTESDHPITVGDYLKQKFSDLIGEKSILPERSVTDWRANVEKTKRACNEILQKLREFNESNSKVRSLQQLRRGRNLEFGYKRFAKVGRIRLGRRSRDGDPSRGFSSPKSESGLAINRESGAVRKFDRKLPDIHQWTFLDGPGLNLR